MEPMPAKKVNVKLMAAIVLLLLLVPVAALVWLIPWLSQPAFRSVDEIDPAQLESLTVQMLNHPAGADDVRPTRMAPADFARLLAPLRGAEKIEVQPPAAFNGEYKVRFKDGRRGTIRLRWVREPADLGEPVAAVVGPAAGQAGILPRFRYVVYLQVGDGRFRAKVDALDLFARVRECENRGEK